MRHFSYFLFENFDADIHANDSLNPRRFLNTDTDEILSHIASYPPGLCDLDDCSAAFGHDVMNMLIEGGIIRCESGCVLFDTPVFLREDADALRSRVDAAANRLTDELEECIPSLRRLCSAISNGFSFEVNLYHILCGMIFDGSFFDYLDENNAVATSRLHTSGLDYLSVIYEQCPGLDAYSNGLLCSYNRFANSYCALQSFGDANGNRYDFYRFFRLMETGKLSGQYRAALQLLNECGNISKEKILRHIADFVKGGSCLPSILALMEHFGYVKNGTISVPVYTEADSATIGAIAKEVETHFGETFVAELTTLSKELSITATRHGVSSCEIANELYHLLFGSVNEALVRRGIVAAPPHSPGEGRYLKSIQLH